MITDTNIDKVMDIHKRMIDKTVRVLSSNNSSWVGRVTDVVDEQTFAVRRHKDAETQTVNMFDIRSL